MQRWPECCQSPACSKQGRAVPPMLKTTVSYVHDQQALWCSESGRKFPARAHRQNCRSSCCPAAEERIFKFCPDPHKHFFSAQYLHFKHLWPQICLYVAAEHAEFSAAAHPNQKKAACDSAAQWRAGACSGISPESAFDQDFNHGRRRTPAAQHSPRPRGPWGRHLGAL